MEDNTIKFTKCPACGSEERYVESLANAAKKAGLMREDLIFGFEVHQGIIKDEGQQYKPGTKLDGYEALSDVCSKCGTIYVVQIIPGVVELRPNILVPGPGGNNRGFPGMPPGMPRNPRHN